MADMLKPRKADFEMLSYLATKWRVPKNYVLRRCLEEYLLRQGTMTEGNRYEMLKEQYDRLPQSAAHQYRTRGETAEDLPD